MTLKIYQLYLFKYTSIGNTGGEGGIWTPVIDKNCHYLHSLIAIYSILEYKVVPKLSHKKYDLLHFARKALRRFYYASSLMITICTNICKHNRIRQSICTSLSVKTWNLSGSNYFSYTSISHGNCRKLSFFLAKNIYFRMDYSMI